jgi:hypothetical protein
VAAGKRINMKKVIAFIASHFRRDKIWMRRTHPDKRKYQVGPVRHVADVTGLVGTATERPCARIGWTRR